MPSDAPTAPSKQVAASVERLLSWNDTYKLQIESVSKRISELGQLTAESTAGYSHVVDQSTDLANVSKEVLEIFTRLESQTYQLTKIAEEMSSVLRPTSSNMPSIDKEIVAHVEVLARAVADHQRMVGGMVNDNTATIHNTLGLVCQKLDSISSSANTQVQLLDEALAYNQSQRQHQGEGEGQGQIQSQTQNQTRDEGQKPDQRQGQSSSLSQRQLAVLSETLLDKVAAPLAYASN